MTANLFDRAVLRARRLRALEHGMEHFLLERQPYYDQKWFAAVDRWRIGSDY